MKAIDLFAGTGGFHLGLSQNNIEVIAYSEIYKQAINNYIANFGTNILNLGDITQINPTSVPQCDIITGGFPCQPYSSLGRKEGLQDTRSKDILPAMFKLIAQANPKFLLLENVPAILWKPFEEVWTKILQTLDLLNYDVQYKVLNSLDFGLPQRRKRVFIFCKRRDVHLTKPFQFPDGLITKTKLSDIVDFDNFHNEKYTISDQCWDRLKRRASSKTDRQTGEVKRGFHYTPLYKDSLCSGTIIARYASAFNSGLVMREYGNPRALTPRECFSLQGFPQDFIIKVAKYPAYHLAGNAVSVNVVSEIIKEIKLCLGEN